jgi:hypothetical protein
MSQPTNTYATNDMVGIREDLSDVIRNISPSDVPFYSMAGETKAANTYHEWQLDELAAAANNYAIEGDDTVAGALTATTRRGNYTNISKKVIQVSGTARAVKTAGRADEMDYQTLKAGKELKRDMEHIMVGVNNARVAGNDSTARELASVQAWIATNVDKDSGGTNPTGDGTDARTDGTQRAFTEDQLKTVMQAIWVQGGNPGHLFLGGFNRQVFSTFGGASKMQKAEDSTLHTSYDVYASDFGSLKVVPDRFSRTRDALILDMDHWKVAMLRPMFTEDLAKTGDSDKKHLVVEFTLEAGQQKASGIVADLTTS